MALTHAEKTAIGLELKDQLWGTPYACTSLTIVSGGTANFLYRGVLAQTLPDGERTIVVKHAREFVSANRGFALDVSRCSYEVNMLNALAAFQVGLKDRVRIRTPRLYHFDRSTSTQIIEDLSNSVSMTEALVSNAPFTAGPTALGKVMGTWIRRFHCWTADVNQKPLRRLVYDNSAMRKIRYDISYGAFTTILKKFPDIWEAKGHILDEVKSMATAEYAKVPDDESDMLWGLIHGDFWTGNVLMPSSNDGEPLEGIIELFIIDWEMAQYGRIEYDLGQMIGDMYERKVFAKAENALPLIQGFLSGYGALSDEEAFRVAIHAGQHLVCWYIRRDPNSSLTGIEDQVGEAMRIGSDFIVNGWARDRDWFASTDLACLFDIATKSQ
ncbi:kinase-like domain-containing protein [Phaeosphaeria sp. MPI-PUGE-AT-0046c]|nr:kinase-like domain-containing protein [Phaeosphaeria sp. MPI-PUGE-AT-0046c]